MISVQLRPNRDPHCTPIILPFLVINEPMCFNISLLAPAPVAAAVATATTLAELSWVEAISIGTFGWENSRENWTWDNDNDNHDDDNHDDDDDDEDEDDDDMR